jgi:hypothetical protein
LKKLVAVISQRSLARSWKRNSLASPALQTFTPGPMITPLPEVPNWPALGGANAVVSNHLSSVGVPVLGFFRISGRMVMEAGVEES